MRLTDLYLWMYTLLLLLLVGCSSVPIADHRENKITGSSDSVAPILVRKYAEAIKLMKKGHYADAESILIELTQSYPILSGPQANLGIIYAETGRKKEAELALRKAIKLNPSNPEVYNRLGVLLRENGDFSEAMAAYKQALALQTDNRIAHYNLGVLYDLYLNKPQQALFHYKYYLRIVESDDTVAFWVVDLKRRLGDNMQVQDAVP